ncbi:MAG: 50S ribosomal protein L33 [Candidatus Babeliales bacterium]
MAKKKKTITRLSCESCKERNYSQLVGGKRTIGALKLTKHCARCRKHTPHKETK